MRLAASALLLAALQDGTCAHPTRGETRPLDLEAVARAHREAARLLTLRIDPPTAEDPLGAPYESGLPACRARSRRTVRLADVPEELAGRAFHFGPRARDGTVHVVTSAKSLRGVAGGVLATPELAERFGVRCAPSTARVGRTEAEIDEGD